MTKVAIIDTAPIAARNLFDFVLNKKVDSKNVKAFSRSFAKEELKDKDKQAFSSELQDFSFYDITNYQINDNTKQEELFALIVILSDFKSELVNSLLGIKKINYKNKGKLERQVSPPIQAYQYIGNNKTDIKHSNKSFGLLFE